MSGFIGSFIGDQIKKQIQNRTQESLDATTGLSHALKANSADLKKWLGTSDPTVIAEFKISLMQIKQSEDALAKALNEHITTLRDALAKIG